MFCSQCGNALDGGSSFCNHCGAPQQQEHATSERETVIFEGKVARAGGGEGKLMLTNKFLSWNKSATQMLYTGVLLLGAKNLHIALGDIVRFEQKGKSLTITLNTGKSYKFGFYKQEDAQTVAGGLSA